MEYNNQPACPPRLASYDKSHRKNYYHQNPTQSNQVYIPSNNALGQPPQQQQPQPYGIPSQSVPVYAMNNYSNNASLPVNSQQQQQQISPPYQTNYAYPKNNYNGSGRAPPPPLPISGGHAYKKSNGGNQPPYHPTSTPSPNRQQLQQPNLASGDLSLQVIPSKINSNPNNYYSQPSPVNEKRNEVNNPSEEKSMKKRLSKESTDDFNLDYYKDQDEGKETKLNFFNVISNLKIILSQSKYTKWALIVTLLQFLIIVALEAVLMRQYITNYIDYKNYQNQYPEAFNDVSDFIENINQMKALIIYEIIFIISQVFVLVLFYDSFRESNSIQLVSTTIFNFLTACYAVVQIFQTVSLFKYFKEVVPNLYNVTNYHAIVTIEIIILGVLMLNSIVLCILCFFLFRRLGWNLYRNVGADIKKTKILKRRYIFWVLLKFDVFFSIGIILQCFVFRDGDKLIKSQDKVKDDDGSKNLLTVLQDYILLILVFLFVIHICSGFYSVK